ncbi:MAG TPA: protein arginine kinase [Verrucomicrobiota bacterium]|nr:protein arginine kinase [Verrucomicrobiota bacterium]
MNLLDFLTPYPDVAKREGPDNAIIISSRVRLARNLKNFSFPGWATKQDRIRAMDLMRPAVENLPQMKDGFSTIMDELSPIDKQLLVERHLISREHAVKSSGSAVVISKGEVFSIMINEEDHLRMQALLPGFQLESAYNKIDEVDTLLEKQLDYAFSPRLGYLTACPTNVGTGIRVSAMLHLPGIVLSEQINQIIQAVNKLGLAVRGLYGEGTDALGNIFQVSNQQTLGEEELQILERLQKVVAQVVEHESNARALLLEKQKTAVLNHIGRAYGILANAYSMSSKEAMNLLSLLKLGVDYGFFPDATRSLVDELFLICQAGHLQKLYPNTGEPEQRDIVRSNIIREKLKDIKGTIV